MKFSKNFYMSASYFVILLLLSFATPIIKKLFYDGPITLLYSSDGKVIDASPFSPLQIFPFGTDRRGEPIVFQILEGAKFTFLSIFTVAVAEVIVSIFIAIILCKFHRTLQNVFEELGEIFRVIPQAFLCYLIFRPILLYGSENDVSSLQIIVIQIAILIVLSIPYTTFAFFEEAQLLFKKDYVISSKMLGASFFQITKSHLFLLAKDRFFLLFLQSTTRLFWLITHLGFLQLFLGGAKSYMVTETESSTYSLSNEWSGLIGFDFSKNIIVSPWISLIPLVFVAVSIYLLHVMAKEIQLKSAVK